jgi:hypothetical protein
MAVYRIVASKLREVATADWPSREKLKGTEFLVEEWRRETNIG